MCLNAALNIIEQDSTTFRSIFCTPFISNIINAMILITKLIIITGYTKMMLTERYKTHCTIESTKMKNVSFCSSIQNDDQHLIEEGGGIQVS